MLKGRIFIMVFVVILVNMQEDQVKAQDQAELRYVPGELLVRFASKTPASQYSTTEKNRLLSLLGGGTVKHNYKIVPGLSLVTLPQNQKVEDVLSSYNLTDGIVYAEPNYRYKLLDNYPNDPCLVEQWGMHNTGQTGGTIDADIDAPEAWEIRTNVDPNIIVAVIDTGVDYTHPDLAGNMWINELEISFGKY